VSINSGFFWAVIRFPTVATLKENLLSSLMNKKSFFILNFTSSWLSWSWPKHGSFRINFDPKKWDNETIWYECPFSCVCQYICNQDPMLCHYVCNQDTFTDFFGYAGVRRGTLHYCGAWGITKYLYRLVSRIWVWAQLWRILPLGMCTQFNSLVGTMLLMSSLKWTP